MKFTRSGSARAAAALAALLWLLAIGAPAQAGQADPPLAESGQAAASVGAAKITS